MKSRCVLAFVVALAVSCTQLHGKEVRFEKIIVDRTFRAEGVAAADVNRDGLCDILAGDVWYEAPDWKMHAVRPVGTYDGSKGYSQTFANFAQDVNADGWVDSIIVGLPGEPCLWYENPRNESGYWKSHTVAMSACNETPLFADLLGNGKPVPVFAVRPEGVMAWFSIPEDAGALWTMHAIAGPNAPGTDRYSHGLGVGDLNGDGRNDVLTTEGWWEAPEDRTQGHWKLHADKLGPECADMLVYDVDGDGDSDVITSSAHAYGIWWFEQVRQDGAPHFTQHLIYDKFSQTHAMILVDINADGVKDFVTGKRYFAHQDADPGAHEPAMLYWFELRRSGGGGVEFIPHPIDDDSGVGTQFTIADMNGDAKPDIVTSNKKGVHVFLQAP